MQLKKLCFCSKQPSLSTFYALPSGGKSKGTVVLFGNLDFSKFFKYKIDRWVTLVLKQTQLFGRSPSFDKTLNDFQCDQISQFLKGLSDQCSAKVAQIFGNQGAILKNTKTYLPTFWSTFGAIGLFSLNR